MKICPICRMQSKLSALQCRQCGHQFRTQFAPPVQAPAAPPVQASSAPQPSLKAAPDSRSKAPLWITGGIGILIFLAIVVFGIQRQSDKAAFEVVRSKAAACRRITLIRAGMMQAELVKVLGQPHTIEDTEYSPGINGTQGYWFTYKYQDAASHTLTITLDTQGVIDRATEYISFAKYSDGSGDSATFLEPDNDGSGGYVVHGQLYDLDGNKLDPEEWLEARIRS